MKNLFEIYYLVGLVIGSIIRRIGSLKSGKEKPAYRQQAIADTLFVTLTGLGMFMPLLYFLTSWLNFANYSSPVWVNCIGVIIFPLGIWLLWRSYIDLNKNWSPTLEIQKGHVLVTSGVFHYLRHPMYLSYLLWAIAQAVLIANWIAGPAMLCFLIPLCFYRIPREEKMMLEKFGEQYRSYINRTGRLFPKINN